MANHVFSISNIMVLEWEPVVDNPNYPPFISRTTKMDVIISESRMTMKIDVINIKTRFTYTNTNVILHFATNTSSIYIRVTSILHPYSITYVLAVF
jgi:hypothetical protein